MKFLEEYRDPQLAEQYLNRLHSVTTGEWVIMEFCGGQTHSLVKNGLIDLLPAGVTMVHGPGCPVCVTPLSMIDAAIRLAEEKGVILCSFGDMLRVPGSSQNLLEAKAKGAAVRFFYSPMEAVELARKHPDREVVFFAVGFETTAPANALSVLYAKRLGLKNYSLLTSHVLVPPAISAIVEDEEACVDGFLGAGNVCSVMGLKEYEQLIDRYNKPLVVTGFEPVDLLQGMLMTVTQLERGESKLENQYSRVVPYEGNPEAQAAVYEVFERCDREWRGIGVLPGSGLQVTEEYAGFDAIRKFGLTFRYVAEPSACMAGEILKGTKKPVDCPHFGTTCTPENPLGAPMVSSEGACAAYYHFRAICSADSHPIRTF